MFPLVPLVSLSASAGKIRISDIVPLAVISHLYQPPPMLCIFESITPVGVEPNNPFAKSKNATGSVPPVKLMFKRSQLRFPAFA